MRVILITFLILNWLSSFSQELNVKYLSIPNDSVNLRHTLIFYSDSIVEISSEHSFYGYRYNKKIKYKRVDNIISINIDKKLILDTVFNTTFGFNGIKKLTIEGNALICETEKVIYVKKDDFQKPRNFYVIIDGKKHIQPTGQRKLFGFINLPYRANRKLRKELNKLDLDDYDSRLLRGFEAYEKYGYKYIFGVLEIEKKE